MFPSILGGHILGWYTQNSFLIPSSWWPRKNPIWFLRIEEKRKWPIRASHRLIPRNFFLPSFHLFISLPHFPFIQQTFFKKGTLERSHHKICHEDSFSLNTMITTSCKSYNCLLRIHLVRKSTQELISKMITMQGDDEIYITNKKTNSQRLAIQGHKLDSVWSRTQTQCHRTLKSMIFVGDFIISGHYSLEGQI